MSERCNDIGMPVYAAGSLCLRDVAYPVEIQSWRRWLRPIARVCHSCLELGGRALDSTLRLFTQTATQAHAASHVGSIAFFLVLERVVCACSPHSLLYVRIRGTLPTVVSLFALRATQWPVLPTGAWNSYATPLSSCQLVLQTEGPGMV
jgi:hypothetical protein